MFAVRRSLMFASLTLVAAASAGCRDFGKKDVTNDPAHGNFAPVVGTWKVKSPLTLKHFENSMGPDTGLDTASALYSGQRYIATLPVGTEIRIEHLIFDRTIEVDLLYATGSVISGPYAGKSLQLADTLFLPNRFNHNVDTTTQPAVKLNYNWAVDPQWLGK